VPTIVSYIKIKESRNKMKNILTIKDLDGNVVQSFVDWYYSSQDVIDIYGDVIVENANGQQLLDW
jgi:hypothetical protein